MDRLIPNGIKPVYVLKPYLSNNMDELARDLTTALDESSDRRVSDGKVRRSKSWKSRSRSKSSLLGSSVPKSSTKSEDSESSIDNWIQRQMDVSASGIYQNTDSDDILSKANAHGHFTWRQCTLNMGESDSVNENLRPSREQRRKRKCKRMAIDPPAVAEDFTALPSIASFSQKNKRPRSLKAHKLSKLFSRSPRLSRRAHLSTEMENVCKGFKSAACSSGKRKRCAHERSIECSGYDCKESITSKGTFDAYMLSSTCRHMKYINLKSQEISSSGLSSSDSEYGLLNEESREADDEQSDFFQEPEPATSQNTPVWCEDKNQLPNETVMSNPSFHEFSDASNSSEQMCAAQMDKNVRQIRSGCRRLEKGLSPISSNANGLLPYMPSRNEKSCLSLTVDNFLMKTSPNEKKKRKGMLLSTGFIYGHEDSASSTPESNFGDQVFKNTGSPKTKT